MLSRLSPAQRPHRVTVQVPGPSVPDGDGGWIDAWQDLTPQMSASILPASQGSLERVVAGTIVTTATHIVTLPFHPEITTLARIIFVDPKTGRTRIFTVSRVVNVEERNIEHQLICEELIDTSAPTRTAPALGAEPLPGIEL